ncbi:ribosome silencing factor [Weissella coleopterorum]|uniref:Ribosomal silencing factor RsfS n=1 Tax=Weissella coleopterorum TaxID=2714949 RepID=A0A6G8B1T5_9LACO|nr:ribosome silencing factor [Weissella coleopterorum]QIL51291.1 ribosome silencing factor [Weissella coleopterorum]
MNENTMMKMLEVAVKAGDQKRAEDLVALDIHETSIFTDMMLIMDAPTNRQVLAIAQEIMDQMKEAGFEVHQHEGRDTGEWIVLDFGELTVHVFKQEIRDFYGLEQLWRAQGQEIDISDWIIEEEF